ncbi:SDR family NAD(P)-dependent oxidoreductase [Simiduia agarivorans]|uniref:Short chain dehydrogenase/reductase family oxidoreductase n=1 Tax=Simiduia agarivorans (strain DSM 21679 / JCM 13881 / BCRC 17597 / SA1) TaxID=1117647 RepID=K4KMX2_SIMAS|nr:SDR family NAD(P)-dependent oxidoreductase [Simiduia agarivorans]AFV00372.1 short chain dehydrogenase/reductase family oxidoreductase [Simiduia agarivorans SA1 = DSM 21679]
MHQAIVIGSNGGIGAACVQQLKSTQHQVWTLSRSNQASDHHRVFRDDEVSIHRVAKNLVNSIDDKPVRHLIIATGVLHTETIKPEKRLEDLCSASTQAVFAANTWLPLAWLQALLPLLQKQADCRVSVLSARVGSIGDNRLGGWYSYRASKAALNMMLQTAAIELARRAKGVKLIAFHPGTTDTRLSEPFQANVPEHKLFSPSFVAGRLLEVAQQQRLDGTLSFVDWNGQTVDW